MFARYGRELSGKTFALWGLAFKPNDMRDAPGRVVIGALLRAGARIQAHDPVAEEEARRVLAQDLADAPALLENLQFADKPMEAVQGSHDAHALPGKRGGLFKPRIASEVVTQHGQGIQAPENFAINFKRWDTKNTF